MTESLIAYSIFSIEIHHPATSNPPQRHNDNLLSVVTAAKAADGCGSTLVGCNQFIICSEKQGKFGALRGDCG
jgi:hypothetical protein